MELEMLEKIEGLLMDVATGAATPEVAVVVEALAAQDQSVRARVAAWGEIANGARLAMAAGEDSLGISQIVSEAHIRHAYPANCAGKAWHPTRGTSRFKRSVVAGMGMAACLAVGVYVGERLGLVEEKPSASGAVAVRPALAKTLEIGRASSAFPVAAVDDFWSVARLRALAAQRKPRQENAMDFNAARAMRNAWLRIQRIGD